MVSKAQPRSSEPAEELRSTGIVGSREGQASSEHLTAEGSGEGGATGSTSPNLPKLRERLDQYMNEHGLRSTDQRKLIVDELFTHAPAHVTIDGMLAIVKQQDERIGYATVYRTMRMLAEAGVLHEYKFSDGMTRYELVDSAGHHDHMICLDCGIIREFEEPLIEELQNRIARKLGFSLASHKHELYGKCQTPDCPRKPPASTTEPPLESAPSH